MMKANDRNEVFPPLEARKAIRALAHARTSNDFAARLWDEGLQGKCKSLDAFAARYRDFRSAECTQRAYFSEIDIMMDHAQFFEPLFYLCVRHGFEIPKRIDYHAERERLRSALDDERASLRQMEQRLRELDVICGDLVPPQKVGGVSYSRSFPGARLVRTNDERIQHI